MKVPPRMAISQTAAEDVVFEYEEFVDGDVEIDGDSCRQIGQQGSRSNVYEDSRSDASSEFS